MGQEQMPTETKHLPTREGDRAIQGNDRMRTATTSKEMTEWERGYKDGLRAADAAIATGWVIAPLEPTEDMITAGLIPTAAWQNIEGSALTVNREKMRLRYKVMIATLLSSAK